MKPGHIRVELVDRSLHADYEAVVGVPVPTDVAVAALNAGLDELYRPV